MEGKGQGATVEEQEVTEDQEVEEDHACPGAEVIHQKEMEMMMDTDSMLQVSLRRQRFYHIDDIWTRSSEYLGITAKTNQLFFSLSFFGI